MAFTKIVGAGIHTLSNVHTHNINSSGIITATQFVGLHSGTDGNFSGNVTIDGNLTVNGTTTTLDTNLTEVDKLEVSANNSTVGAAITQSGSGDILNLYDGSTERFSFKDGGALKISSTTDQMLELNSSDSNGTSLAFQRNSTRQGYIGYGGASNGLIIANETNNGGVAIQGKDGGSVINMLSFDAANEGVATLHGGALISAGKKVGFATDSNTYIEQDALDRISFTVGGLKTVSMIEAGTNYPVLIVDKNGTNTSKDLQGGGYYSNPHANDLVIGNVSSGNHGMTICTPSTGHGNINFSDGNQNAGHDSYRGSVGYNHSTEQMIVRAKSGAVILQNNATNTLVAASSGRVGIGSEIPGGVLDLYHATSNTILNVKSGDAGSVINLIDNATRSSIEQNGASLKIISDTVGTYANSDIRLQVDGSTKMRINSDGEVLIGTTTNPTADIKLLVSGNGGVSSGSYFSFRGDYANVPEPAAYAIKYDSSLTNLSGAGGLHQYAYGGIGFNLGGQDRVNFTTTGNVGIGSDTPAERLVVQGDGFSNLAYDINGGGFDGTSGGALVLTGIFDYSGSKLGLMVDNAGQGRIMTKTSQSLYLGTNNTRRLSINNLGYVGIKTTNALAHLDLRGVSASGSPTMAIHHSSADVEGEVIRIGRTDLNTIRYHSIKAKHGGAVANNYITFNLHDTSSTTSQTEVMRLRGDGKVLIGTNSSPDCKLHITNGTLKIETQTTFYSGSGENGENYPSIFLNADHSSGNNPAHGKISVRHSNQNTYSGDIVLMPQGYYSGSYGYEEVLRVSAYKRVGINKGGTPGHTLDVYNEDGSDCLRLDTNASASGSNKQNAIRFSTSGTVRAHVGVAVDAGRVMNHSASNDFCVKTNTANSKILVGAEGNEIFRISKELVQTRTLSGDYYPVVSARDGSSSGRAATSAWEIKKTLGPAARTGYYYLKNPYDDTVSQWWCDMDTDGGGWILVAHTGDGQMASLSTADGNHWYNRSNKGGFDTVGSGYYKGGGYWRGSGGAWAENTCGQLMWDVRTQDSQYDNYSNAKVVFNWGTGTALPTGGSNYTNIPGNRRFNEWCYEVVGAPGFNPSNYHQNARGNVIGGANYFTEHMVITWSFRGTGGGGDDGDSPYWMLGSHHDGLHQHYEESLSGNPQGVYGSGGYYVVSNEDTNWGGGGSNDGYPRIGRHTDNGTCNVWLR